MGKKTAASGGREFELQREGTLLAQLAGLTSPTAYATTYGTHGIHPYPAKYIPQLPNLIIREHTNERNTVLDPFCGSGTTLLEAALLGRKSLGVDSNPIAALVSRVKTTALSEKQLFAAQKILDEIPLLSAHRVGRSIPDTAGLNLRHWFSAAAIRSLGALRFRIDRIKDPVLRDVFLCALSKTVVWASNQESETRYAAIQKGRTVAEILSGFQKRASSILAQLRETSESDKFCRNTPIVLCEDIKSLEGRESLRNIADLVVTSPPYPNSFDYYLYHKWRMVWLGYDYKKVMADEIGSRREHSSLRAPISAYQGKMRDALSSIAYMLKPAKLAYFFVGDAVIGGEFIDISTCFEEITKGLPFRKIADTKYRLEAVSRSFREKTGASHGGARNAKKMQHVLVYERLGAGQSDARPTARVRAPGLPLIRIEEVKANGSKVALKSEDSNRHIHSLGRYPSKFIPEVPRWAIEKFAPPGGIVMDPFVGSGTTAVEAVLLGRSVIASDFSPYAHLITSAKISQLKPSKLSEIASSFETLTPARLRKIRPATAEIPLGEFWFPAQELEDLLRLRALVESIDKAEYQQFFQAVLSTCIRACSYQDAGQIKVKRDPKKVLSGVADPLTCFLKSVRNHSERKLDFLRRVPKESGFARVVQGSADNLVEFLQKPEAIDLIVTSPPYINAMNYPMTHRLESFVLGLVDPLDKIQHETGYIGTERVRAADYRTARQFDTKGAFAAELNPILIRIFEGEPKRSFVAFEYFRRMQAFIAQASECLKTDGYLVLVAGRNTIKGVPVPTVDLLGKIAVELGFELEQWFDYAIVKNALKFTRNNTARMIDSDGVFVLRKGAQ